jgi:hypothetical protein
MSVFDIPPKTTRKWIIIVMRLLNVPPSTILSKILKNWYLTPIINNIHMDKNLRQVVQSGDLITTN